MPHVVHDSCVVLVLRAQVRVLYSHVMYQHSYTGPPDHGHRFALNSYSLPAGCVRAEYMRYMNVQKKRQNPKRKENVKPSESRIAYACSLFCLDPGRAPKKSSNSMYLFGVKGQ